MTAHHHVVEAPQWSPSPVRLQNDGPLERELNLGQVLRHPPLQAPDASREILRVRLSPPAATIHRLAKHRIRGRLCFR
ncbi:hypothetical protein Trco_006849 [Trichoderma cornu-damae]|uniref:Uncharacterized protein n=1 Tax=Trichoderma cornu-damae TaxID=654480 RepID=A0A9P8QMM2_9HYPO|nr:hypothetical protein Trco_006849 [Trichoderma cornu-damae]